jgi:hypothetical protein
MVHARLHPMWVQCGNGVPRSHAHEQKCRCDSHSAAKISASVTARAANQLSLIRSFLIDSAPYGPFCAANFKKIFCL